MKLYRLSYNVHVIWLVLILVPCSLTAPAPVKREVFLPTKAKESASIRISGGGACEDEY